jgi:hypothetical protein
MHPDPKKPKPSKPPRPVKKPKGDDTNQKPPFTPDR